MKRTIAYCFLILAAVVAVAPFLWLVSTSFKGSEELFAFPPTIIPEKIVFENYTGVWNAVPFLRYTLNSIFVVAISILLNVGCSALAGFALARYRFKGREFFFILVLAAMMVPKEVVIIPLYTTILKLGLADSLMGIILPFAVEGFGIFLMRQAFLTIPKEMEEAAVIDGASPLRIWWNVMLPMIKSTVATLTVFTFIGTWGDFLWPLVVVKSPEHYTLQVGLSAMMGTFVDNYRYVAAGAVLAVIPVLAIFLLMQSHFERGILTGATKE